MEKYVSLPLFRSPQLRNRYLGTNALAFHLEIMQQPTQSFHNRKFHVLQLTKWSLSTEPEALQHVFSAHGLHISHKYLDPDHPSRHPVYTMTISATHDCHRHPVYIPRGSTTKATLYIRPRNRVKLVITNPHGRHILQFLIKEYALPQPFPTSPE